MESPIGKTKVGGLLPLVDEEGIVCSVSVIGISGLVFANKQAVVSPMSVRFLVLPLSTKKLSFAPFP